MTLVILLLVFGYLISGSKYNLSKINNEEETAKTYSLDKYNLPVAGDSENVSSVLLHYFFMGKLEKLKKVDGGTQIFLADADPSLPRIIVAKQTRVHKVPSFSSEDHSNDKPISVDTLKTGQIIDISAEFDLKTNTWFILDVFLVDDRNEL